LFTRKLGAHINVLSIDFCTYLRHLFQIQMNSGKTLNKRNFMRAKILKKIRWRIGRPTDVLYVGLTNVCMCGLCVCLRTHKVYCEQLRLC